MANASKIGESLIDIRALDSLDLLNAFPLLLLYHYNITQARPTNALHRT